MTNLRAALLPVVLAIATGSAATTGPSVQAPPSASQPSTGEPAPKGIPVTSELVRQKCGPCHAADDQGRLSRISYQRTTPEGWQQVLRRMAALNGLAMTPEDGREIVRYLADHHGLAPAEARPGAFEVERRNLDYKYAADSDVEATCTKCHSMGRVITQRRTKEEWELLLAMHRGYYPLVDFQAFRRMGPLQREPGPDGRPPDNRHPMEKAVEHLSAAFPLETPEWSAWSATMRAPRLEGRWALSGYQPGVGPVYGEVVITTRPAPSDTPPSRGRDDGSGPQSGASANGPSGQPGAAPSREIAFETEARYVAARTGRTETRKGRATVYTGYQWRGRSSTGAPAEAPGASASLENLREVLFVDRDWQTMSGRWFTGAQNELGMDVQLHRVGRDPIVLGTGQAAVRTGATAQTVQVHGVNFPTAVAATDVHAGPGVRVSRVVSATPTLVTIEVDVAADAVPGIRDVMLTGASGQATLGVYDQIHRLKVLPQAGLSRVGGANFPRQYEQFESRAFHNGADGKPDTKDDIDLGLVPATWSLEEYTATFDDDDKSFVGTLDPKSGLFTPNLDGPNPKRRNNANNYGDVWVVATYAPPGAETGARPIRARAHLLVTVPLYMDWEPDGRR